MSWFDQKVYWDRSTRVKEVCEKFGLRPEDKTKKYKALQKRASLPPERSLMYLPTFNLLYCWVHKAASTSWNKIFFKLAEKALNRTLYIPEKSIHEVSFRSSFTVFEALSRQQQFFDLLLRDWIQLYPSLYSSWWSDTPLRGLCLPSGGLSVQVMKIASFFQGQV